MVNHLPVFSSFFDLYPPDQPYIRPNTQYGNMFESASTVVITIGVKDGTIFDDAVHAG